MLSVLQENISKTELELINQYIQLIYHWNKTTNITSRHNSKEKLYEFICEAVAITKIIGVDKSVSIVDVGSGAGFPGMIFGILGYQNTHLIEIRGKKAAFLQYVMAELRIKLTVHHCDVKNVKINSIDYITSKAVTSTNELLKLCKNIIQPQTKFILCKSEGNVEIMLADQKYRFVLLAQH